MIKLRLVSHMIETKSEFLTYNQLPKDLEICNVLNLNICIQVIITLILSPEQLKMFIVQQYSSKENTNEFYNSISHNIARLTLQLVLV